MGSPQNTPRGDLLADAARLVVGDRDADYGPPSEDFERTAAMWSAYRGCDFTAADVGIMLCLVKISRMAESPTKRDHYADLAGYAACAWECVTVWHDDDQLRKKIVGP